MSQNPLVALGRLGQSPWYDYITRDLLASGALDRLIAEDGLLGLTSNPTIFEKAIGTSALYDDDIRRQAETGASPAQVFEALAVADVQAACDRFRAVYERAGNGDGTVSLEVSPALAHDTAGTVAEARRLWRAVDRPNLLVKIPGTREGIPAIAQCIEDGISVNVTLLFSVDRYREVIDAWFLGLERRATAGHPLGGLRSVASFFISRVDSKVDPLLDRAGDPHGLRGRVAIANAALAYAAFEESLASSRWQALAALGAVPQRPLWASTSTKDPAYADVHYVEALVAPRTVNTLPPETFAAYRDHGRPAVRIGEALATAPDRLAALAALGIDLAAVTAELEREGVEKFAASHRSLLQVIEQKAGALAAR